MMCLKKFTLIILLKKTGETLYNICVRRGFSLPFPLALHYGVAIGVRPRIKPMCISRYVGSNPTNSTLHFSFLKITAYISGGFIYGYKLIKIYRRNYTEKDFYAYGITGVCIRFIGLSWW